MKKLWHVLPVIISGLWTQVAFAQSGSQERAVTEFNGLADFMVKVMTGPASKVLALVFLLIGVWKIIHQEYGAAVGCVLALLALVFLPNFLGIFGG